MLVLLLLLLLLLLLVLLVLVLLALLVVVVLVPALVLVLVLGLVLLVLLLVLVLVLVLLLLLALVLLPHLLLFFDRGAASQEPVRWWLVGAFANRRRSGCKFVVPRQNISGWCVLERNGRRRGLCVAVAVPDATLPLCECTSMGTGRHGRKLFDTHARS